jgi:hypothetical protein
VTQQQSRHQSGTKSKPDASEWQQRLQKRSSQASFKTKTRQTTRQRGTNDTCHADDCFSKKPANVHDSSVEISRKVANRQHMSTWMSAQVGIGVSTAPFCRKSVSVAQTRHRNLICSSITQQTNKRCSTSRCTLASVTWVANECKHKRTNAD